MPSAVFRVSRIGAYLCGAWFLLAAALHAGAQDYLSHDEFSEAFTEELRRQAPDLEVQKVGPLDLTVVAPSGGDFKLFLDNAYLLYRDAPDTLRQIVADRLAALRESLASFEEPVDLDRVVPVIRSADYVQSLLSSVQPGEPPPKRGELPANEPYAEGLVVVFAEDTDSGTRFLSEDHLTESGMPPDGRRAAAIRNLKNLLPEVRSEGGDGTYLLIADGTYESSLLLFDEIWRVDVLPVQGEFVVAIPARNVLLITGSENLAGLETLARIIDEVMRASPYKITDRLFVRRGGQFVPFGP